MSPHFPSFTCYGPLGIIFCQYSLEKRNSFLFLALYMSQHFSGLLFVCLFVFLLTGSLLPLCVQAKTPAFFPDGNHREFPGYHLLLLFLQSTTKIRIWGKTFDWRLGVMPNMLQLYDVNSNCCDNLKSVILHNKLQFSSQLGDSSERLSTKKYLWKSSSIYITTPLPPGAPSTSSSTQCKEHFAFNCPRKQIKYGGWHKTLYSQDQKGYIWLPTALYNQ